MKRTFTKLFSKVILPAVLVLSFFEVKATFTPVPLTGFNADVVANGIGLPTTSTTAAFDNTVYCLPAPNYQASATGPLPPQSMPANNIIASSATSGINYQLAPYTGNNSLRLTGSGSGTLVFGTPGLIGNIYVLGGSGDAGTTGCDATITVTFTDNSTQAFTGVNFPDWFTNTTGVATNGLGRVNRTTGVLDASNLTNPHLFERKLTLSLANYSKQIASITVLKTSGATNSKLNIFAVNVDHNPCVPVSGLTATGITTTTANLSWTAPASTQGYEYAITTSATPPASGTTWATTSVSASGLAVGTIHYLHVRNSCGSGSFSVWNTYQFTTLACPSAGAPTISNNVPGSATVSWPGSTDIGVAGYHYIVSQSSTPPASGWQTTTATTVNVSSLTPGATYWAHVRSNCNNTNAGWQTLQFINPFPPCFQPSNISITNVNMHGANIKWNSGFNGIGYRYQVSTNPVPPAAGTTTTDTTLEVTGLTEGTTYYVHLRTHCGTTNFSPWVTDSFTTSPICQGPIHDTIYNVTSSSAYIEWNYYPGIQSYEYFINQTATPPSINGYTTNTPAAAPINLNSGTKYFVHIRVVCDATNAPSAWVTDSFTTISICNPPVPVTITGITGNSASFSWPATINATYEVGVSQSMVAPPDTIVPTFNGNSYVKNNLLPNTSYVFYIRSICNTTDTSEWAALPFTTAIVAVNEVEGKSFSVSVYPNPVKDVLNLQIEGQIKGEGRVMIYDLSAKLVVNKPINAEKSEIDMAQLPAGMYILKYVDSESTGTVKIQKQ